MMIRPRTTRSSACPKIQIGTPASALATLGEHENGTVRLVEAVAAYREALKERTWERTPYYWEQTQRNLERALKLLEERKRHTRKEPRDGG